MLQLFNNDSVNFKCQFRIFITGFNNLIVVKKTLCDNFVAKFGLKMPLNAKIPNIQIFDE